MNAREYYEGLLALFRASPLLADIDLRFTEVDEHECYVRGLLTLRNGLELHFAEYVLTSPHLQRPKYRYHVQRPGGEQVARWDNAPHHPEIVTHPHHMHTANDQVHPSPEMAPEQLLINILSFMNLP